MKLRSQTYLLLILPMLAASCSSPKVADPPPGTPSAALSAAATSSSALSAAAQPPAAQSGDWTPVTGADELRDFISDKTLEWEEPGRARSRGEYRPDGTGTLHAWGASTPRTWEVKGEDQICITARDVTQCYQLERNTTDPTRYRARDLATGRVTEIRVTDTGDRGIVQGQPKDVGNQGSAAAPSADEIAAQLANPNAPLASLNFKNQFRFYKGDLPHADSQSGYTLLFQPVLPFPLPNKDKILFRPAIPLAIDQPTFDADELDFDGKTGFADIGFDLAYAHSTKGGLLLALGAISSIPTGTTSRLTSGQWTLGPEILIAQKTKHFIFGAFPKHQWDVTGWSNRTVNVSTLQPLFTYLPGGGWNIGTTPIIRYDWHREQWTVPLGIKLGKTLMINGRPWKFAVQVDYFVQAADEFAPEWLLSFDVTPVVQNVFASWLGLK